MKMLQPCHLLHLGGQWEWACDLFTSMTRAALEPNSISHGAARGCGGFTMETNGLVSHYFTLW